MPTIRNNTLKSLFILAALSTSFLVKAEQQVTPDTLSQPIAKEIQVQALNLMTMDCGMNEGLNKFTATLKKLPVDVSSIFLNILQEGVPIEILDSARRKAALNYKVRQIWLKDHGMELFDEQTVEHLSKVSLENYINNSIKRLKTLYEENALLGLRQIGKPNVIDIIKTVTKQRPELSMLSEITIKAISLRENVK